MSNEISIEQVQALMRCVAENEIGELLFETGDTKLRIRGKQASVAAPVAAMPAAVAIAGASVQAVEEKAQRFITSPIVGTFYASSSPDKDAFVSVGQSVREGETVFIVESMKVMNEVPAECGGTVAEILVADGDPVEYGQPILRLE